MMDDTDLHKDKKSTEKEAEKTGFDKEELKKKLFGLFGKKE